MDGKTLIGATHDEAMAILDASEKQVQLVVSTQHSYRETVDTSFELTNKDSSSFMHENHKLDKEFHVAELTPSEEELCKVVEVNTNSNGLVEKDKGCQDIPGLKKEVILHKVAGQSLGILLYQGKVAVTIKNIVPGSPAYNSNLWLA